MTTCVNKFYLVILYGNFGKNLGHPICVLMTVTCAKSTNIFNRILYMIEHLVW